MPIGIINKDDYLKEIGNKSPDTSENTPARSIIVNDPAKGRGPAKEVPEPIRALIAQEVLLGAPSKLIAQEFKVSPSSISAYKNGATSTASYNNPANSLKKKNVIFKDRIVKRASRHAIDALDSISPSDFASASLRDKAAVAKEMASIVRDMSASEESHSGPAVQFIIHAPQMRKETDYIDGIVSQD